MRKRTSNVALSAMFLAGLGYVTGLLTAPKSGKETREDIHSAASKVKSEAEKRLKTLHSELAQLIDHSATKAHDAKDTAQDEFAAILGRAQIAREKARELLSALHEGDAEDRDLQKAMEEVKKATEHLKKYLTKHEVTKED